MNNEQTILVTGADGQLGQSFKSLISSYPQYLPTFTTLDDIDFNEAGSIDSYFRHQHFDIILNCAAYTNVDKAESEPAIAEQINHLAVKQLAQIAKRDNSTLIHVSTDYVFVGTQCRPYNENDKTGPQSVYGSSKLNGELAMLAVAPKGIILRTSWLYSEFGNNFVKTMIRLGLERDQLCVVFDQVGTPTYAGDLARAIVNILDSECFEEQTKIPDVYHFSNEGVTSWYDFANEIFNHCNIDCNVLPIESVDYPTPAKRPYYSLLNKSKVKSKFDLQIPYWKDSLVECMNLVGGTK